MEVPSFTNSNKMINFIAMKFIVSSMQKVYF